MDTHFTLATALSTAGAGFLLTLSLIAAIGAQNLFVLRQGLQRQHVGLSVLFCTTADLALTALGVAGMAEVIAGAPRFAYWMTLGGALFLLAYAVRSLHQAWRGGTGMATGSGPRQAWPVVLAQLAALTLLNPHVYLDTVVLMGSVGARYADGLRWVYVVGAAAASLTWFVALGYGARWLQPVFAQPRAWRWLDTLTGLTMLALAGGLVLSLPQLT